MNHSFKSGIDMKVSLFGMEKSLISKCSHDSLKLKFFLGHEVKSINV